MIYQLKNPEHAAGLFCGWNEALIWSCLQQVMGRVYVDHTEHPRSAMAILGDFCFFAGEPDAELVAYRPKDCQQDFRILIARNAQWHPLIEACYGERARRVLRYAIKKEANVFQPEKLQTFRRLLPDQYTIRMIDEELYHLCRKSDWSLDLVSQYADYAMYQELGIGVGILCGGELVAGASSYATYHGGIEIEIDTKKAYRRQGLATVCGAELILECLKRGLYPSWDAQNLWSVALAEKLGYHFDHEYPAFEIWG